jgi:hypothetical protein
VWYEQFLPIISFITFAHLVIYLNLNYVLALSVFIMYCVFQEVQGRPLRLNLVVDSKKPSSSPSPAIDQNKGNNVNSLGMLFGISK